MTQTVDETAYAKQHLAARGPAVALVPAAVPRADRLADADFAAGIALRRLSSGLGEQDVARWSDVPFRPLADSTAPA